MKNRRFCIACMLFLWPWAVMAQVCKDAPANAPLPGIFLQEVAAGFDKPVHLTHAGDGSGRLFVVEQAGVVRIIKNGKVLEAPFLDIRARVSSGGEKGLLSIAFHPRYRENGEFYVNYTRGRMLLETIVSRFRRGSRGLADPGSEEILLRIRQPFPNHNGGQLQFGPDGYLYIGMGDGGAANDPLGHGQDITTLLGALLRIDVDNQEVGRSYAIPPDNPFLGRTHGRGEIWAYGLRNPWRFSFDARNGRLFLADVGQDRVEEINIVRRGGNYGWAVMEGDRCLRQGTRCRRAGFEMPIFTYPHPEGFSVTGGYVYRGRSMPELCGVYVFADYVSGVISGLRLRDGRVARHGVLRKSGFRISSFGEDEARELYVAAHRGGRIFKIIPRPVQ